VLVRKCEWFYVYGNVFYKGVRFMFVTNHCLSCQFIDKLLSVLVGRFWKHVFKDVSKKCRDTDFHVTVLDCGYKVYLFLAFDQQRERKIGGTGI